MHDAPSRFPVELDAPPPPPTARRRHRVLTAPSGLVLFACLFLPAYRSCGEVDYAFDYWPFATPYLLGLLVALLALARSPRLRAALITAARVALGLTLLGWTVALLVQTAHDAGAILPLLAWCATAAVMIAMFGIRGTDERAAIRIALATAALGIVWFTLWCLDPNALLGIQLAAAASGALLVGAVLWRRELSRELARAG
jgi:hypothetical protein